MLVVRFCETLDQKHDEAGSTRRSQDTRMLEAMQDSRLEYYMYMYAASI